MVHVNRRELLFNHGRHAARRCRGGEQGRRVRLRRVRHLEVRARRRWVPRWRAPRHSDGFGPVSRRGHRLRVKSNRRPLSSGVARWRALRTLHVGSRGPLCSRRSRPGRRRLAPHGVKEVRRLAAKRRWGRERPVPRAAVVIPPRVRRDGAIGDTALAGLCCLDGGRVCSASPRRVGVRRVIVRCRNRRGLLVVRRVNVLRVELLVLLLLALVVQHVRLACRRWIGGSPVAVWRRLRRHRDTRQSRFTAPETAVCREACVTDRIMWGSRAFFSPRVGVIRSLAVSRGEGVRV